MENSFDCTSLFSQLDLQGELSKAKNKNLYLTILLVVAAGGAAICYYQLHMMKNENDRLLSENSRLRNTTRYI